MIAFHHKASAWYEECSPQTEECQNNYCFIVIVIIKVINDVYVFMVIVRVYFLVNEDLMSFK